MTVQRIANWTMCCYCRHVLLYHALKIIAMQEYQLIIKKGEETNKLLILRHLMKCIDDDLFYTETDGKFIHFKTFKKSKNDLKFTLIIEEI